MIKISKSDYVLASKCPNAIWFKHFRKDLQPQQNTAVLERGTYVGEMACKKFPGGIRITAHPWESDAITQTKCAISNQAPYIYEATLATDTGEYCAVDILKNNNDGTWDIIEVKSTNDAHEYHFLDVSFQKYVFIKCGIKIRNCYILTFNKEYVRHGELDINVLFMMHNADAEMQSMETVDIEIQRIRNILNGPELAIAISKAKCKRFYECGYKFHCWRDVPPYSVFDAFRGDLADKMYKQYGADLSNLPPSEYKKQQHQGMIEAFLDNTEIINTDVLREFTNKLQWPLYFLDYESVQPAIPMFDNSRPYQQICFQFSMHIQRTPGGELEHHEYLHDVTGTDPRPGLIKKLVETIGDTGSVIVYNQSFEKSRHKEMATDFPEYANQLLAINTRILDLLVPFKKLGLYRPCQIGSASIKKTLPAFVPDMSYEDMEIHNGGQASDQFLEFITGNQTADQTAEMLKNLHDYCGQDTLAMVRLLDVIQNVIKTSESVNQ